MLATILSIFILLPSLVFAYSNSPPDGVAGEPPNRSTCINCHNSFRLNDGEGGLSLFGLPEDGYVPNETYRLEVMLGDSSARRWGFQLTAIDEDNDGIGEFDRVDRDNTVIGSIGDKQYVKHTSAGSYRNQRMSASWEVDWTAPEEDIGEVFFYFTGNAANNNNATSGDFIYSFSESMSAVEIPEPDRFTLNLYEGWNFVSSPVAHADTMLESLLMDVIQSEAFMLLRDVNGNMFYPAEEINDIDMWNPTMSYEVLMNDEAELLFEGSFTDSTLIVLEEDWNWIAYTRTDTTHPSEAFASLENNDRIAFWAKDAKHHFYVPDYSFNGLGMIEPGNGIKLHYTVLQMDSMNVFSWQEPQGVQDEPYEWLQPQWNEVDDLERASSMSILVAEWGDDFEPTVGAEILVMSNDNDPPRIAGIGVVAEGDLPIIVWGSSADDFEAELSFIYWDESEEVESFPLSVEVLANGDEEIGYAHDSFSAVRLTPVIEDSAPIDPNATPTLFTLNGVYPNPFNNKAEISFSVAQSGDVNLKIWDLSGRLIQDFGTKQYLSGRHSVEFNGDDLSTGMYLIDVENNGKHQFARAVLLR